MWEMDTLDLKGKSGSCGGYLGLGVTVPREGKKA